MQFYGISGSWRTVDEIVAKDVEMVVQNIIDQGDGIITGGALGVDYIATQLALSLGDPQKQLKIYLPISVDKFFDHYKKRTVEGVITSEQCNMIISQLREVLDIAPQVIYDQTPYIEANVESYYARNTTILKECDILYAFQVNESQGVQDAINKAIDFGKPVTVKKYTINS